MSRRDAILTRLRSQSTAAKEGDRTGPTAGIAGERTAELSVDPGRLRPAGTASVPGVTSPRSVSELAERFAEAARSVSAEVFVMSSEEAALDWLTERFGQRVIVSTIQGLFEDDSATSAVTSALTALDGFLTSAAIGVAENGAVWLPESSLGERANLFLAEEMVVLVSASVIVEDMHEACRAIDRLEPEGFGVFVAGPSKTADIEQALVIGAQGPRRMTIVLVEDA